MIVLAEQVHGLPLPVSVDRSEGVHQSAIIRCIALEMGILKFEVDEDLSLSDSRTITDPTALLRIHAGLAWEEHYIRHCLPTVIDHPGELCIDNIYMTPDGEELDTILVERREQLTLRLHEVKYTYKSTKTVGVSPAVFDSASPKIVGPMSTQWMWLAQIKGYCYGARTRFATFHVYFACGDYSWPQRPQLWRFHLEFTQAEIDSNWSLLREYRDDMVRGLRNVDVS